MADERMIPPGIRDASTLALNDLIDRMGTVDIAPLLVYLIDNVDGSALPHLVEQFHIAGLEGNRLAENDTNRRALIKSSIAMHKIKGTPDSIKQTLLKMGFGETIILEGTADLFFNGVETYNGLFTFGNPTGWAEYIIRVDRPVTAEQAVLIRKLCEEFAPARCKLAKISYAEVAVRYNNESTYNGNYNYGVIAWQT